MNAIAELNDHADRSLLIVEDDKPFLERLSRAMETRGFTVTSCDSVSDGLAQIGKAAPAFAVVDLRLGDGNGLDVVSALKRKRPDARAIVLTGYGNIATAVTAVKMGAVDYLSKPADADDVVAALLASGTEKAELPPNPMSADRVRWEHIQRIYEMCNRNVSETARRLNMHRRTLQRILAKRAPRYSDRRVARRPCAGHHRLRNCERMVSTLRCPRDKHANLPLKLRMPLRIDQAVDPLRGGHRKAQRHRLAGRRRQAMLRRLAMQMRAIGVGDDQAGVGGKDLARQILREGEEQPVAMGAVFLPFLVGTQILDRGLDLDDPDLAALVQRHQIGAAPRRQRQFADAGKAERPQQPRGAARDRQRRLRLAAVRRRARGRSGGRAIPCLQA